MLIRRYSHTISKNQKIIAFYEGDELVCLAMRGLVPKRGYVNLLGMAVPEWHQRKGIGKKVLRVIAEEASANGLTHMKTQAYNAKSMPWYEQFNFVFDQKRYALLSLGTLMNNLKTENEQ